jgi:AraC-like DNA-binding protein
MYDLVTLGNRLLIEDPVDSPLGYIRLAGTNSGVGEVIDRTLANYALVYVVSGAAYYRDQLGADYRLDAGDALLIAPGVLHSNGPWPGREWEHIWFVFGGPLFSLMERSGIVDRRDPVTRLSPVSDWTSRLLLLAKPPEAADVGSRSARVLDLASAVARHSSAHKPATWLDQAKSLLGLRLADRVRTQTVAEEMSIPHETFRKRFRREAGISAVGYRDAQRLLTAAELLRSTPLTLREIASLVGYTDEFHLSRKFSRQMGEAPSRFRRTQKNSRPAGDEA